MTLKQLEELFDFTIADCKEILLYKGKQYASSENVLHNFRQAGMRRGASPEDALAGMVEKHDVFIADIVMKTMRGEAIDDLLYNKICESIIDRINYNILLKALLTERHGMFTKKEGM